MERANDRTSCIVCGPDKETGLYYYRARYYDPMEGRFISKDPIGFKGGINVYAYVQNNPIDLTDPNGLRGGQTGNANARTDCSALVDIFNDMLSFFGSIPRANETLAIVDGMRASIPCGVKRSVTICFRPGSPPTDVTVNLADGAWTKPHSGLSCPMTYEITGYQGCECMRCHHD